MAVVLRLVPPPNDVELPPEHPAAVEERAWEMVEGLRAQRGWKPGPDLADPEVLRDTLQVVGELDLELLVTVAAEALEAFPDEVAAG